MLSKLSMLLCFIIAINICFAQTNEQTFSTQLDQYLQTNFKPGEPGIAVLVGRPNQKIIFSKGYGLADIQTKQPITTQTLFNLGSVSKTFVGLGILKLQEEGKLSIEDPLEKYFPDFRNKDIAHKVKIKHLLSHTSGLPDNRPVTRDSVFFLTAKDAENFAPILQNEALHFEPGERFEYSNPAFNGLALIIEKMTGMKWQQFIQQTIFKPAGMNTSVITDGAFPQSGVSHGYQQVNGQWQEYDYGEYPTFCAAGNGGVWSSVDELFKYEEAIQKNKFLNKHLTELARTPFSPPNWKEKDPPFVGYDWFVNQYGTTPPSVGHSGDQAGFKAEYWYLPKQNILIVILNNSNSDLSIVTRKILELMKENKLY